MAAAVEPEKILKELHQLWQNIAKEDSQKGASGILRACAMTLIVAVEGEADSQSVSETVGMLMHEHPSRAVILRAGGSAESGLDARVFAQRWIPVGGRQQIGCEEVEITASAERFEDLPKLVLALIVPDLPVVLWFRGERLCRDKAFQQLFGLADKIIVDSSGFAGQEPALGFLRETAGRGHQVADLTWTRLTRLRETVAQIFGSEQTRSHLKDLKTITLTYTGPDPAAPSDIPLCVRYVSKWLSDAAGQNVKVEMERARDDKHGAAACWDVRGIRFSGPGLEASVEIEKSAAEVRVGDLCRRSSFLPFSDYDLLREELSVLGPDTVFRKVLESA